MKEFNEKDLKKLYTPASNSRKGDNGRVLVIGGSDLFHSPAFWAFEVISRIVDIVHFASTPMNNDILKSLKSKYINGIVIPRGKVFDYIEEDDSILIGPGLPRDDGLSEEEESTKIITDTLLTKYPEKKWVVDGGSLQMIRSEILPKNTIITPNKKEFEMLFGVEPSVNNVKKLAKKYNIVILLKGSTDYICSSDGCIVNKGGNPGMTKGGTGDVLAGLVTAFYAKNDAVLSASAASYINKKAGESLEKRMGIYFNTSDLVEELPKVMRKLLI